MSSALALRIAEVESDPRPIGIMLGTKLAADCAALVAALAPAGREHECRNLMSCLEDCLHREIFGRRDIGRVYRCFLARPYQEALEEFVAWWKPPVFTNRLRRRSR